MDGLVKRLREAASFSESRGYSGMANTVEEAAYTIEELTGDITALNAIVSSLIQKIAELSKYADAIRKLKCEGWYLQQARYYNGYQAIKTMPLPTPPKEEK